MRCRTAFVSAMAVGLASGPFAGRAFAESAAAGGGSYGERVRVSYAAPLECPDEAQFLRSLSERIGAGTLAGPDELARTVDAALERSPSGYLARVTVVNRDGRPVHREVSASTCAEAVDALVVVVSVSLRNAAEVEDAAVAAPDDARPPDAAAAPSEGAPVVAANETANVAAAAASVPEPAAAARDARPSAGRRSEPPQWGGALLFVPAVAAGVGPGVAFGAGARVEFTWLREGSSSTMSVGYLAFDSGRTVTEVTEARFRQQAARLELAPWEVPLGVRARLSPVLGLEAGRHVARAYSDPAAGIVGERAEVPWLAATVALRSTLRWGPVVVALGPELRVPVARQDYVIDPHRSVYRVPMVAPGFSGGVGIGW